MRSSLLIAGCVAFGIAGAAATGAPQTKPAPGGDTAIDAPSQRRSNRYRSFIPPSSAQSNIAALYLAPFFPAPRPTIGRRRPCPDTEDYSP
jgi:hypothetical protein